MSVNIHLDPYISVYMTQYVTCVYMSVQSVSETDRESNKITAVVL